ncbi:MAG: TonB-dependent receptor [Gemmatimonadaceae bacterium]|nr:TonB-dependent receptor [Gemmatimonadaceae bacterium]
MLSAVLALTVATRLTSAMPEARAMEQQDTLSRTVATRAVGSARAAGRAEGRAEGRAVARAATARDSARTLLGEVRGRVLDAGADVPLASAFVVLEGNGTARMATSALDGGFVFPAMTPGHYTLLVTRAAYRPTRLGLVVPEGSALVLDVQLTRLPVSLSAIVVQASRDDEPALAPGIEALNARYADGASSSRAATLLASPGAMTSAILGVVPGRGAGDPGSGGDGRTLFIWGAKDAGARVTLDGIPLGAPLHLGGLLPVVDEDVMAPARMWSGGAPARYDGGTDYVLDLRARPAATDSLRLWATIDVLSERAGGELPLGSRGSLMAGVRRVNDGRVAQWAGADPGYAYGDGFVRLQLQPAAGDELRATALVTDEALDLPRDQGIDNARWGNRAGSLAWERTRERHGTLLRAGLADAVIDLPLLTLRAGHLRADSRRLAVLAEHRWGTTRAVTAVGVEGERMDVQRTVAGDSTGAPLTSAGSGDPCPIASACDQVPVMARVAGTTGAVYVDHRRLLAPWLQLGVGGRAVMAPSAFDAGRVTFLPRLALEATPSGGSALRLGVGGYSRTATLFDESGGATVLPSTGLAASAPVGGGAWLSQSTAMQLEVGASQRWSHAGVSAVAYWQRPQRTGVGQSALRHRGIDLMWQYARGATSLTASYSRVAREVRAWDRDSAAEVVSSRLEQVASLGAAARLWRLYGSLSASYARGLSFAAVVLESANRSAPASTSSGNVVSASAESALPPQRSFLRVDATISSRVCVAGPSCRVVLAPYARVLNALDRRDAIFYYRESPSRDPGRLGWLPALLSVGVRADMGRSSR